MLKQSFSRTLLAGVALTAVALSAVPEAKAETVDARFGLIFAPAVPLVRCGAEVFAANEDVKAAGLNITVIHSSQLGSELEMVQQVSSGELEMTLGTSSLLAAYVEGLSVLETYYLYDSVEDVAVVHRSAVAEELFQELLDVASIRRIGTPWLYGERHIFGNKQLREPADFEGLRLRVPQTAVSIASAQALGASPTPTTYGELYISLQQGIVDAAEAPAAVVKAESFHEPSDYFNMTRHLITAVPIIVNEDFWQSLSEEQREVMHRVAVETAASVQTCVQEADKEALDGWRADGSIEIVDDVNRKALKEKVQAFYSEGFSWSPIYKELIAELAND